MATTLYPPLSLDCDQSDGNIVLRWQAVLNAVGYTIQRSTDGFNFSTIASVTSLNPTYLDALPGTGVMYWYRVQAFDGSSPPNTSPYSNLTQMVAAPPGEMSLYELRLTAQQTADRVGSGFVTTSEWNKNIRLSAYELYDILMTSYEDYFASSYFTITTDGVTSRWPLPDGATNYFGLSNTGTRVSPVCSYSSSVNPNQITVSSATGIQAGQSVTAITAGHTTDIPTGSTVIGVSGTTVTISQNVTATASQVTVIFSSGAPAGAFYKLAGMDLNVNSSPLTPSRVTMLRYNFIKRNQYVYPNSTSTIYGVYNMRYRTMGNYLNIIPTPAAGQQLIGWYSPRLPGLLSDTDVTTIGISGWLRYVIVRAALYALAKEQDPSITKDLEAELSFLKQRITEASQNRDEGQPDTISETRQDMIYGGTGWNGPGIGGV